MVIKIGVLFPYRLIIEACICSFNRNKRFWLYFFRLGLDGNSQNWWRTERYSISSTGVTPKTMEILKKNVSFFKPIIWIKLIQPLSEAYGDSLCGWSLVTQRGITRKFVQNTFVFDMNTLWISIGSNTFTAPKALDSYLRGFWTVYSDVEMWAKFCHGQNDVTATWTCPSEIRFCDKLLLVHMQKWLRLCGNSYAANIVITYTVLVFQRLGCLIHWVISILRLRLTM